MLTGCLFSLAEGCCLPFLCVGIPALGKGMEDEAGYLRQTRSECDSRWSNELSVPYVSGDGKQPSPHGVITPLLLKDLSAFLLLAGSTGSTGDART